MTIFKDFLTDQSGAVTVDWVVLTAAIVGLGMVVVVPIAYSTENSAEQVGAFIQGVDIGYTQK